MIPVNIPWKLIGYGVAAVALVAVLWWAKAQYWDKPRNELKATAAQLSKADDTIKAQNAKITDLTGINAVNKKAYEVSLAQVQTSAAQAQQELRDLAKRQVQHQAIQQEIDHAPPSDDGPVPGVVVDTVAALGLQ